MSRIFSHSLLETAVCEARFLDAMKPRYGKAGPARQGQAGHRLAESYMKHLHRLQQDSDHDAARGMWAALKHQLNAEDERAMNDAVEAFIEKNTFPFVIGATDFESEAKVYVTVPDRKRVPADRVHLIEGPVFRVTMDVSWRGEAVVPKQLDGKYLNVLDWKWHRVYEHVAAPNVNRQLLRYAAALREDDDDFVVAALHFPRHNLVEDDVFDRETLDRAWRELIVAPIEEAERKLPRIIEAPDKCVGTHCRNCDLRRGCDAALRYPFEVLALEQATIDERATAFVLAKALAGDLGKDVKARVNAGEVIDDEDDDAEIRAQEMLRFSRESIEKIIGDLVSPEARERMFKATKSSVDKELKAGGIKKQLREELLAELRAASDTDREVRSRLHVGAKKKPRGEALDVDDEGSA